ncbi:unnamed protein product, partial [Wuchereria bancrofti]
MIEDQNLSPITAGRLSVLRKILPSASQNHAKPINIRKSNIPVPSGSKNPPKSDSSRKSNIPLSLSANNQFCDFGKKHTVVQLLKYFICSNQKTAYHFRIPSASKNPAKSNNSRKSNIPLSLNVNNQFCDFGKKHTVAQLLKYFICSNQKT